MIPIIVMKTIVNKITKILTLYSFNCSYMNATISLVFTSCHFRLCVSSKQILYYSNCRMSLHEALYSFRLLWLMQTIYTPSIRNNLCRIPCYLFQCNRKIFIIVFHFHLCHLHFLCILPKKCTYLFCLLKLRVIL